MLNIYINIYIFNIYIYLTYIHIYIFKLIISVDILFKLNILLVFSTMFHNIVKVKKKKAFVINTKCVKNSVLCVCEKRDFPRLLLATSNVVKFKLTITRPQPP